MTYFGVLATFILPPLLLLWIVVPRDLWAYLAGRRETINWMPYISVFLHVLIALVYTTPWDNYLVASGVWWYDPALVTGLTIGWVPIEEYTFFIVQTLLTGIWTVAVLQWSKKPHSAAAIRPGVRVWSSLIVGVVWVLSTLVLLNGWAPGRYLTLILSWALIPVLIQVAFGGDILLAYWRPLLSAILVPSLYLWWVDSLAITSGTWTIDPAQTTGWMVGSLPVEEMIFFGITKLMIGFGFTLLLVEQSRKRFTALLTSIRKWSGEKRYSSASQ